MKRTIVFLFTMAFAACVFMQNAKAQVTTNGGSGLDATYPSLASAISALNSATISSPVVITLTGNETAPAGGYSITQLGATSTNPITIQGSGGTITAGLQTAGSITDAVFKITCIFVTAWPVKSSRAVRLPVFEITFITFTVIP